jgi:tetratricopeptide (TPR) repeat protein
LEGLYEGATAEIAPALARHFAEAKDAERAFRYALLAAEHAETAYDYKAAGRWFRLATDHLPSLQLDPQVGADVWHRLGRAEVFTGSFKEAELCYRQALDYLQQSQADGKKADVLADLGYCYTQTDRSQEAIALLEEALALNQQSDRLAQAAYDMVYLAFAYHKNERQDLAKDYLVRAGNQFEALGDLVGQAAVNRHLGIHYRIEGNFELSVGHLEEAARLDREAGYKFDEASDYTNLGSTYLILRDDEVQAMAYYQRSLELSHLISKVHEEAHVLLNIARLFALQGEWSRASQSVEEGLRLSEIVQETSNIIRGHWYRGIIRFYQGHVKDALADYEYDLTIGVHDARVRWGVLYNLGSLQLEAGMIEKALRTYCEAGELLLSISEGMPSEKRAAFFQRQQKVHVFRALRAAAECAGQLETSDLILFRLPAEVSIETNQPLPRFYWGGGKWI